MSGNKYNYLLFEANAEGNKLLLADLFSMPNVKIIYKDNLFHSKFFSLLFHFHFSQKVNRIIDLPFKSMWYAAFNKYAFADDKPLCYMFTPGWYGKGLVDWLKRKHPQYKRVMFFRDTVQTYLNAIPSLSIEALKKDFDLVLVYNPGDAAKYGFTLTHAFFSKYNLPLPEAPTSDLVFIGVAKDRLPLLNAIFTRMKQYDINCNFYITGTKDSDENVTGITYADKAISYKEYLSEEVASNCILEVVKGDTMGCTYRCWEAVYYNKKLLTNWKGIKTFKYYNPKYMMYFEKGGDIDIDFVRSRISIDYHYGGDNSPRNLIHVIEQNL